MESGLPSLCNRTELKKTYLDLAERSEILPYNPSCICSIQHDGILLWSQSHDATWIGIPICAFVFLFVETSCTGFHYSFYRSSSFCSFSLFFLVLLIFLLCPCHKLTATATRVQYFHVSCVYIYIYMYIWWHNGIFCSCSLLFSWCFLIFHLFSEHGAVAFRELTVKTPKSLSI